MEFIGPAAGTLAYTCPGTNPHSSHGTGPLGRYMSSHIAYTDGPVPAAIQQFYQPVRDTHLVGKTYDGPPFPSTILPPYQCTYHLLEQTGLDPSWSSLKHLGICSGAYLCKCRLESIFYSKLLPAGTLTQENKNLLLQCYSKNSVFPIVCCF